MNLLIQFRSGHDTSALGLNNGLTEAEAYNRFHWQRESYRQRAKNILAPIWVPNDLVASYVDFAALHGEDEAKAYVRRILHGRQLQREARSA